MSLGGMGSITCCAITCSGSPELHKWVAQGGQWGYKIGRSSGWKLYAWYPVRRKAADPPAVARLAEGLGTGDICVGHVSGLRRATWRGCPPAARGSLLILCWSERESNCWSPPGGERRQPSAGLARPLGKVYPIGLQKRRP